MGKITQEQKLLEYMEKNGSISVHEAVTELWINSPTKVISVMRRKGHDIREFMDTRSATPYKRYYKHG